MKRLSSNISAGKQQLSKSNQEKLNQINQNYQKILLSQCPKYPLLKKKIKKKKNQSNDVEMQLQYLKDKESLSEMYFNPSSSQFLPEHIYSQSSYIEEKQQKDYFINDFIAEKIIDQYQKNKKQSEKQEKLQQLKSQQVKEPLVSQNASKQRKIRTSVSEQKISVMEHLFPYIMQGRQYKDTTITLKDISKIVDLGYSTVLHKYKNFRRKGTVEKGLLLKCKDFKRKYHKSLKIQNYIKQSLKQKNFKTAKQLAAYVSEKYKINANRSIISRHLNQMQRQKFQFIGQAQFEFNPEETRDQWKDNKNLSLFSQIYFGLKSQNLGFNYFNVIRLYYSNGKLLEYFRGEQGVTIISDDFLILNLMISCTEKQLLSYQIRIQRNQQKLKTKTIPKYPAFQFLYQQLASKLSDDEMFEDYLDEKVYFIFPFSDSKKQFDYRLNFLKQYEYQKINFLVMPPRLQCKNLNFIQQWLKKEVLSKIQKFQYESYETIKEEILYLMDTMQNNLEEFSNCMFDKMKKLHQ